MDAATIGIACLLLVTEVPESAPMGEPCFPPMAYGEVAKLVEPVKFEFYPQGTPEFDQHWAAQTSLLDDDRIINSPSLLRGGQPSK